MPRKKGTKTMVLVNVYVPREMFDRLNELVKRGVYPNMSEAIRHAIGEFLITIKGRKLSDYPDDVFIIGR